MLCEITNCDKPATHRVTYKRTRCLCAAHALATKRVRDVCGGPPVKMELLRTETPPATLDLTKTKDQEEHGS